MNKFLYNVKLGKTVLLNLLKSKSKITCYTVSSKATYLLVNYNQYNCLTWFLFPLILENMTRRCTNTLVWFPLGLLPGMHIS